MPSKSKPRLESQSIYSFDLDSQSLTFRDYDLFAPARDLVLHMGFTVKKISTAVTTVKRCDLRRARADAPSLDEAVKTSQKIAPEMARVVIVDGAVNFKIPDQLPMTASDALLLVLEYSINLQGQGPKLLFSGAVQPSDYKNIHNSLRVNDIAKQIVLQVYSKNQFSARIFNASNPQAFPQPIHARRRRSAAPTYLIRETLDLDLQDWERALYFSICQD